MCAHESSEEWAERQAQSMRLHQCERPPEIHGTSDYMWTHKLNVERAMHANTRREAARMVQELLNMIIDESPGHDHREYGCNWCRVRRDAIAYMVAYRRNTDGR